MVSIKTFLISNQINDFPILKHISYAYFINLITTKIPLIFFWKNTFAADHIVLV